jgi:hypothetical protein
MKYTTEFLDALNKTFDYDADTGLLTRKSGQWSGHIQQAKDQRGYVITYANGKTYRAHRLIWLMFYKETPPKIIDHINGITSDNRIENLRAANASQNMSNRHAKPTKKSPLPKGVWVARKRFVASVYVNGKRICAGRTFATPTEAAEAYNQLAITHHKEFAQVNQIEK